jgi:hypothetical protein
MIKIIVRPPIFLLLLAISFLMKRENVKSCKFSLKILETILRVE